MCITPTIVVMVLHVRWIFLGHLDELGVRVFALLSRGDERCDIGNSTDQYFKTGEQRRNIDSQIGVSPGSLFGKRFLSASLL